MYDYIKGTVTCLKNNSIVLDNNGVGFLIYVSNPYSFEVGKDYKVFVYQHIREDEMSFFGFKTLGEKELFLQELGIEESGLDQLVKKTYSLLGLATYFTVGSDEVKAWTFRKGMKAPECAGIIHSDFERGFIKAEVMSYDDLIKYGSETKVKEAGRTRLEGKEYVMQDGDICYFRFNV